MIIFPAIDLINGNAVRLTRGDYSQMTVYSEDPAAVAAGFAVAGAGYIHVVDLEGARDGGTPNFSSVCSIIERSGLRVEAGGGIRDLKTVEKYLSSGAFRVILGTAALTDRDFLKRAVDRYGERIAVGVDLRDGFVAVRGWTETTGTDGVSFISELVSLGVGAVICTDISKDGVLGGTNEALYAGLAARFPSLCLTASGGVSDIASIKRLAALGIYGTILGKALYTGSIALCEAVLAAK